MKVTIRKKVRLQVCIPKRHVSARKWKTFCCLNRTRHGIEIQLNFLFFLNKLYETLSDL